MGKLSKERRGMLLNVGFIVLTLLLVLFLVSRAGDPAQVVGALRRINPAWLLAALGCLVTHILLEGYSLRVFFRFQGVRVTMAACTLVGLMGMFYSNVTPAATGGQPMQAYALRKRGVAFGTGYSALAVKFFCWQCALLLTGAVMWAFHEPFVRRMLGGAVWFAALGFLLNSMMVVLVILLAINRNFVRAIIIFLVNIAHRVRLVKDKAATSSRLDAALNDFHSSVNLLTGHPMQFLALFLLALMQVSAMMSVIYAVYRGFGLARYGYSELITIQFMLYIAASFTPLPGASGAQEGGFYLFFRGFFPEVTIFAALLVWRFFTYYLFILLGFGAVAIDQSYSMRRARLNMRLDHVGDEPPVPGRKTGETLKAGEDG
ncbi:MAG TPA: lysylphosphatidylglycerol synthase transmembrane domain-containing protein [Candidatus Limnocylindria bacterium]|nr:lysylphosphatidylglycerol synthase transmembrane domain-containing protein [Candidatus Limnocylindria bacterium]